MRTLILIVGYSCFLLGTNRAMADGEHIWNTGVRPNTYVDYELKNEPIGRTVAKLARRMGFLSVTFADNKLKEIAHSGKMERVPAWRAIVSILQAHQLDFDVRGYELQIMPRGELPVHYQIDQGMVCRFVQQPIGTTRPVQPKWLPYDCRIFLEPRLAIKFANVTVNEQLDARGRPCKLLQGGNHPPLMPQIDPREPVNLWPGLDGFKVQLRGEFVDDYKYVMVKVPPVGSPSRIVKVDGIRCYDVNVRERDGFVDLNVAVEAPKTGGFAGDYEKRFLEQATGGYQFFVHGDRGSFFENGGTYGGGLAPPDIVSGEGGGDQPLVVTLRYKPETLRVFGGLEEFTITVAKPRSWKAIEAEFSFANLSPETP